MLLIYVLVPKAKFMEQEVEFIDQNCCAETGVLSKAKDIIQSCYKLGVQNEHFANLQQMQIETKVHNMQKKQKKLENDQDEASNDENE